MPAAFKYSGYVIGPAVLILTAVLTAYCMNILLYTHQELCKRKGVPTLSFSSMGEFAFQEGPDWMHKISRPVS